MNLPGILVTAFVCPVILVALPAGGLLATTFLEKVREGTATLVERLGLYKFALAAREARLDYVLEMTSIKRHIDHSQSPSGEACKGWR